MLRMLLLDSHSSNATERRPGQFPASFRGRSQKRTESPRQSARVSLGPGRRGCAGDSARPAAHGCANRSAGCAPDRKRYDTPDRRTEAGAHHSAFHGASAGIRVPTSIPIVIPPVIDRVGEPANIVIILVGGVPIGVAVCERPVFPVGIQPFHPPACAVRIACDVGTFDRLGAGYRGGHQGCARNSEKRTQSNRSVKPSHFSTFFTGSHLRQI